MKKATQLITFISIINTLSAANWYVAPNGNNNNPGTLSQPFKTIPKAIEVAVPGDIIELRNGNYPSNEIRISKSNLTIRSYIGEWAIITATTKVEDISSCIWYDEPNVKGGTLERLEIVGGYYYGVSFETNWDWGLPTQNGASNITIRNCKIHDTGRDCIKIKPACNNIQILSSEIYNSGVGISNSTANGGPNAEGIDNVNGDGMVIRNCYIHDISTSGVYVKGGAKNCIIEENLIYRVQEGGILLGFYTDSDFFDQDGTNPDYYECQYSQARNNIVYNTGGAGIGFFAARNCSAYNNTVVTASPNFHAPLYFSSGEIWISNNLTLKPPNFNIEVYNNIFVDQGGNGDEDYTVQIREGALSGTNFINYNIYQKINQNAKFDDGISWPALTFSKWKSQLGFDANSKDVSPMLDNNWHLTAGSPAIDAGYKSPANKDYDAQPRSGNTDIGADEYGNGMVLQVPPPANFIGTGANTTLSKVQELFTTVSVDVYPNPVSEYIYVKLDEENIIPKLAISSIDGKQIKIITGNKIRVEELPNGLYFLSIWVNGARASVPIIVQH